MRRIGLLLFSLVLAMSSASAQSETEALLASMTIEQKAAQLFLVGLFGPVMTEAGADFLTTYQPGGVVVFAYNDGSPAQVTQLINDWQRTAIEAGAPPLLIAVDQEGGRINTLEQEPFTQYPTPMLWAATGNANNVAYDAARALAQELRAVGIHMNLAPVADLETNPNNTVMFRRMFGSEPDVVGPVLDAVVRGFQDEGVLATLKHFPGHGDTAVDSHVDLPVIAHDRARLDEVELASFRAGFDAEAVMVGHLLYSQIDPALPASLSRPVITGLLREEMGYGGLVMTDALDMDAIDVGYGVPTAAVMAVEAGVDLLATGPHVPMPVMEGAIVAVADAVRAGRISEARLDEAAARVLDSKARYGVLGWSPLDPTSAEGRVRAANGEQMVEALFRAGVTVAYDDNNWLPFDDEAEVMLVYPGTRSQIRRDCAPLHPNLQPLAVQNFPSATDIQTAAEAAVGVGAVVVFTQNAIDKPEQTALVNALPAEKTIVVAFWSPYDWLGFPAIAGYVTTYSPALPAIPAACSVLFGTGPTGARLPLALLEQRPVSR